MGDLDTNSLNYNDTALLDYNHNSNVLDKAFEKKIIFSCSTCKPLDLHFTFPSNLCICISHFLQYLNNATNFSYENSCTIAKINELFSLSISMKVTISLKSIMALAFSIQSECNKIILVRKIF